MTVVQVYIIAPRGCWAVPNSRSYWRLWSS